MNHHMFANSECSSGCESGWTLYLENSYIDGKESREEKRITTSVYEQEEEAEDLSMVSDASSGPPHAHEDECYISNNNDAASLEETAALLPKQSSINAKRHRETETRRRRKIHHQNQNEPCLLDDTASSPIFDYSHNVADINNQAYSRANVLDFSQGYSATHFQGESAAYQQHYGFFHHSLTTPGNLLQHNQWCEGNNF